MLQLALPALAQEPPPLTDCPGLFLGFLIFAALNLQIYMHIFQEHTNNHQSRFAWQASDDGRDMRAVGRGACMWGTNKPERDGALYHGDRLKVDTSDVIE